MTCALYVEELLGETKGGGFSGVNIRRHVGLRRQQSPYEEETCPGPLRVAPGVSLDVMLLRVVEFECQGHFQKPFFLTLHRQHFVPQLLSVSLQVPAIPELPLQRNGSALGVDPHPGAVRAPGQWVWGVCVWQMHVRP